MESDKMKYLELKNTVEKLLDFMEKYNLKTIADEVMVKEEYLALVN